MIKKFRLWLIRRWRWYRHRMLYVICDARDNSITLSHALFDMMDVMNQEQAKAFVFKVCNIVTEDAASSGALYGFCLNPDFKEPTQLCDIQYNGKHRTIGFETLCPTVNRIFYDYGISAELCTRLSVEFSSKPFAYYIILPPRKS